MAKQRERRWLLVGTALFIALGSLKMYRDAKKKSDVFSEDSFARETNSEQSGTLRADSSEEARSDADPRDGGSAEDLRQEKRTTGVETELLYVHVAGRVKEPGLYTFHPGARIDDAIRSAGGFCEDADADALNLSMKLSDEMKIVVPKKSTETTAEGQAEEDTPPGKGASEPIIQRPDTAETDSTQSRQKIDLNTATLEELMTLPSVGEKRARDIIAYRSQKPFSNIEELKEIAGFGEKTFAKLRDYIEIR